MKTIIKDAGKILRQGFNEFQKFSQKERGHLLSEYDIAVNNFLTGEIIRKYPDDSIFSEEGGDIKAGTGNRWIIDPIDGTSYFIFGEPFFSISAAKEHGGKIIEAHVFNPISEEYYYSDISTGISFLNDVPIHVSNTSEISDSLIAFGFSANMKAINSYYKTWAHVFDNCKKGIAWICPALSICNVARGRCDAFIDNGASFEGQAAASLILANAGGKLLNYDRSEYNPEIKGGIFFNGRLLL